MSKPCPTPKKRPHPNEAAAREHLRGLLRRTRRSKGDLHPYRCVCGAWHLGHTLRPRRPKNWRPKKRSLPRGEWR